MTTVVFVHGTGVRGSAFEVLSNKIACSLAMAYPAASYVARCWGDTVGAQLGCDGASIPGGISERGTDVAADDVALWAVLELDPWYELTFLAAGQRSLELAPGALLPGPAIRQAVAGFPADADLQIALDEAGLASAFSVAAGEVMAAEQTGLALQQADHSLLVAVLARALVAAALRESARDSVPTLDGDSRDELVLLLQQRLAGGGARGPIGGKLATAGRIAAEWLVDRKVQRKRLALTSAVSPAAGDILHYLVRGAAIRSHVAEVIKSVDDDVLVLGHSLGGVIGLEMLGEAQLTNVVGLVTVGSQSPYLYELDALPTRQFSRMAGPLPPYWCNIFDRRDLLAFVAGPVFGPDVVRDEEIDSRVPFPRSHSAYFGNKRFYQLLGQVLLDVER